MKNTATEFCSRTKHRILDGNARKSSDACVLASDPLFRSRRESQWGVLGSPPLGEGIGLPGESPEESPVLRVLAWPS